MPLIWYTSHHHQIIAKGIQRRAHWGHMVGFAMLHPPVQKDVSCCVAAEDTKQLLSAIMKCAIVNFIGAVKLNVNGVGEHARSTYVIREKNFLTF